MKNKKVLSVILVCALLLTNAPLSLLAETNNNISKNKVIQTSTYDDIREHWAKEQLLTYKNSTLSTTNENSTLFMPEEKIMGEHTKAMNSF